MPSSNGLATPRGKTVGWELAPWERLTAWQEDLLGRAPWGSCSWNLSPPPCSPEVAIKPPSQGACEGGELMARMGSIVCYEIQNVPYHSPAPGGGVERQLLSAR